MLGLETRKKVSTPWVNESFMTNQEREALKMRRTGNLKFDDTNLGTPHRIPEEGGELDSDISLGHADGRRYMSAAASLNFVALDQPRLMYSVKELMRKMATPTRLDEMRLKRVVRYMSTAPRVATCYPWEPLGDKLTVECDSDFAGCVRTRKSTAGGAIYWGD